MFVINSVVASEPELLFRSDEVIEMELRSDFFNIINDRTENPDYQDAELSYITSEKQPVTFKVKIISRGHFRRNPDICNFPPLYINFKKGEVKNTLFDNQDKLKLVTPCQGEDDLLEEYIIYKMYNRVTDMSLKVRLVKILYFDTGSDRMLFERYSFFLEDPEHAAGRNDAMVTEKMLTPFDIDRENFKRMSVFQYLIGNIDWSIMLGKNIILMQPEDTTRAPYAVPYDFDFSAFVSAHYTLPRGIAEEIVENRRKYRGICFTTSELIGVFDLYSKLRRDFESIVEKQKSIPARDRNQLLQFLNYFYTVTDSDDLTKKVFLDGCLTRSQVK